MPSKSKAQHNLMEAAAHGSKWASKKISPKVAKDFVVADKANGKSALKKLPKKKSKGA